MDVLIQKDSHDNDMFLIKHKCTHAKRFILDFIIHGDCLCDFMEDMGTIKDLALGEMLAIELNFKLKED